MIRYQQISLFTGFLIPFKLFAALSQGTLGTTSTGTLDVSITIPALVQITKLTNIVLTPTNFSSPSVGSSPACIYSNVGGSPAGTYYVTATSSHASGGVFNVQNGSDVIGYTATWIVASPAASTTLVSGTKSVQQNGGSTISLDCSGSTNASFQVSFSQSQVQGAPAAVYTDTVTLLITPT